MPEQKAKSTYRSGRGGTIVTLHSDRKMMAYTVYDGELTRISSLGTQTTICASIAGSCITTAVGLVSGIYIEGSPSEQARLVVPIVSVLLVIVAIVFACFGVFSYKAKKSEIDRIKRESTPTAV